jgi:hypothetical protein
LLTSHFNGPRLQFHGPSVPLSAVEELISNLVFPQVLWLFHSLESLASLTNAELNRRICSSEYFISIRSVHQEREISP